MSAAKVRAKVAGKPKRVRRRRVRWNHDAGPWCNGFDAGWRDAHRGVNFGGSMSGKAPGAQDPEARRVYAEAYRRAHEIVDGPPQVRKLEGDRS